MEVRSAKDYGMRHLHAKKTGTCLMCGSPARSISDRSARLEYRISALCRECRTEYFGAAAVLFGRAVAKVKRL